MKTYILVISTIIITAGLACNQAMEPSPDISNLERLQEEYSEVGKQHNESLDHVLESFDRVNNGKLTPVQVRRYALDNSRQKLKSYYESPEVRTLAAEIHDREADRVINPSPDSRLNATGANQSYYARTLELSGLAEPVKEYIIEIGKVIDSGQKPVEIENQIRDIVKEAEGELSDEDFKTVFLAAEVGIASAHYWEENGEKWLQKVEELKGDENQGQDLDQTPPHVMYRKSIIKSDMAGAVGGAIGSAITGCAQLTLGACAGVGAAAGGLSASAATAVQSYLDYIWEADPVEYPDLNPQMRQVQSNTTQ